MKQLSKKEVEIISSLEFHKKYFFTAEDIDKFAKNRKQRYNIIWKLLKKKRILKLNRHKYYLIPIRAKGGSWVEHPFIVVDEMMDSKDYFIGGWAAANYWHLTDQIPVQVDVYTTRRKGKLEIMNTRILFRHTTPRRIERAVTEVLQEHGFRIIPKEEAKKWMRSHR